MVERQGKAPLDSGDSTRAASNGVNFRDLSIRVFRLRTPQPRTGHIHGWNTSNAVELSQMMMASVCSCIEAHAGYRLRSAMVELSGQQTRALGPGLAGFNLVKEFCEVDRALLMMR